MTTQSTYGRYRIGKHIVELRTPRLSDAASWRQTNLEHEERLRPAFGTPRSDWAGDHSLTAWAHTWLAARSGAGVPLSRVLVVEDGDSDRVVGQQTFAGPDPRTGHAESSTWIAGLDDSNKVAVWMSAANVLEMFRLRPEVRYATAPLAVTNVPAIALAKAVGLQWVHDLRGLREYNGEPVDHTVYVIPNTAEAKTGLQKIVAAIGPEPVPPRRAAPPSPEVLLSLARQGVRQVRSRRRAGSAEVSGPLSGTGLTEDGHDIAFAAAPDGRYTATADGTPIGQLEVQVDPGTSTTEIIDRLRDESRPEIEAAALVAACRTLANRQDTRRLTLALADRHASAVAALIALGFESEGDALPTSGDEATTRSTWTRYREQ